MTKVFDTFDKHNCIHASVVIIGAGISGLSAAKKLKTNGIKDIIILEANDRIGGRINSIEHDDGFLELGAQFVHGKTGNPIFEIAREKGYIIDNDDTKQVELTNNSDYQYFMTSDGEKIHDEVVSEVMNLANDFMNEAEDFYDLQNSNFNINQSLGNFLKCKWNERKLGTISKDEELKEALFDWKNLHENLECGCDSINDMSLYSWGEYTGFEGQYEYALNNRYSNIVETIKMSIPDLSIHFNYKVEQIFWQNINYEQSDKNLNFLHFESSGSSNGCTLTDKPVILVTNDSQIIFSDHVIVTVSLGILKKHSSTMFVPKLPDEKIQSIENLGFGTVNKLFLQFEKPFWTKDMKKIVPIWLKDFSKIKQDLECIPGKYLWKNWFKAIDHFHCLENHQNILCAWIAGKEALITEAIPDNVLSDILFIILRHFCVNFPVTKPIKIMRTQWGRDGSFLGSYAFMRTGSSGHDCEVIAKPIKVNNIPRILFSGEHTSKQHISTVNGGFLSGERCAETLLELYNSEKILN